MFFAGIWLFDVVSIIGLLVAGYSMTPADEIPPAKMAGSAKAALSEQGDARLCISRSAKKKLLKAMKKKPKKFKNRLVSIRTRAHDGKSHMYGKKKPKKKV